LVKPVSSLASLAKEFGCQHLGDDVIPKSAAMSSSFCEPGSLFIALQGEKKHGLDFLGDAKNRGAIALLTDRPGDYDLPTLVHPNPRAIAGLVSKQIYKTPSTRLLAVTGTNGKTSTAFYLHRLLNACSKSAGLISSAAQIIGDKVSGSELTTPEAPRVHHLLSQMRQHGQSHAALEVSAQALVRNRVDGLRFEVAGFSNLSRDHLDDFGTMENYLAAKAKLFDSSFSDKAVINVEDEYGLQLYNSVSIPKVGIGEGLDYQSGYEDGTLRISGKANLSIPFSKGFLMSKNFALALVMLLEFGIDKNLLEKAATEIELQIPGRLERVSDKTPAVYVDYAHTPAGVAAAVSELKSKYQHLVVVLGASGNRDKGKREEMALACAGAQVMVITDQHPRDEDPAEIRSTLLKSAKTLKVEVVEEPNPAKAIATAISLAGDGAVLWCGPGQLKYREIKGEKVPFDAIAVAREAVENA
jgi:UDP-N-acetylmuramoyl-L-alanyl-D-glutamate--2,6-diaminopimelate ligase